MNAIRTYFVTALSAMSFFVVACAGGDEDFIQQGPSAGAAGGIPYTGGAGGSVPGDAADSTAGSGGTAGGVGGADGSAGAGGVAGADAAPDAAAVDAAPDGTAADAAPDGSAVDAAPDGSAVDAAPDGSAVDAAPDGAASDATPDASADAAPDGSAVDAAPDGTAVDAAPDGAASDATPDVSTDAADASVSCEGGSCASCSAILASNPGSANGIYAVDPDGAGGIAPIDVYCDMTGSLSGGAGGGWMLLARDPGATYDVPASSTTLNAWNGDLANRAGYLSVDENTVDLLAPAHVGRFQLDGGSWYAATADKRSAASCGSTGNGCVLYWAGEQGAFFYSLYADATNAVAQDLVVYQSASNSSAGCPELWNTPIMDGASQPIAGAGTAGTGDCNARSGAGCWGVPSTGPVAGEVWVR